jgi:hypothetical protein
MTFSSCYIHHTLLQPPHAQQQRLRSRAKEPVCQHDAPRRARCQARTHQRPTRASPATPRCARRQAARGVAHRAKRIPARRAAAGDGHIQTSSIHVCPRAGGGRRVLGGAISSCTPQGTATPTGVVQGHVPGDTALVDERADVTQQLAPATAPGATASTGGACGTRAGVTRGRPRA